MLKDNFSYAMLIISLAIFVLWPFLVFFNYEIWPFLMIFHFLTCFVTEFSDNIIAGTAIVIICGILVVVFYELFKGFTLAEQKLHHH